MKNRRMTPVAAGRISDTDGWCRYWLPYCFQELSANRRHVYLPLNRNYKPLGVVSPKWVNYNDHIDQAVVFASDPHTFPDVWTGTHPDKLYLYKDGTASRLDYFERLERLLSRSVRLAEMISGVETCPEPPRPAANLSGIPGEPPRTLTRSLTSRDSETGDPVPTVPTRDFAVPT